MINDFCVQARLCAFCNRITIEILLMISYFIQRIICVVVPFYITVNSRFYQSNC